MKRFERDVQHSAELYSTLEQVAAHIARAEKAEAELAPHVKRMQTAAETRARRKGFTEKWKRRRLESKKLR